MIPRSWPSAAAATGAPSAAFRALVALLFVLVAAACGAPVPPTAPVAPRVAPARTAAAAPRAGAIRAGTSGDYPPLSKWSGEKPEGFAPALLEAFAQSDGHDVAWTRFKWPDLVADVRAGRFDVAADGITVRPERSIAGRFTVPIARGGAVLLVRRPAWAGAPSALAKNGADTTVTARAALAPFDRAEFRVVVNRGGHLERVARSLFRAATVTTLPENSAVRDALANGQADAVMTNTFEAPRWAEGLTGIERIGPLTNDTTALWVGAEREELAERLDSWLLAEEESGRLGALRSSLLGPGGGGPSARAIDALLAATAERLALMPFVAAAKLRAKKAVEDTKQEERVIAAGTNAVAKAAVARGAAPPPRERIVAFFRAQIEAAKAVQARISPPVTPAAPGSATATPDAPAFTLEELRDAIARITARMAFLLVRVAPSPPAGASARAAVMARARADLADTQLDAAQIDALATTLAALTE